MVFGVMIHSRVLIQVIEILQANVSGLWGFFIRNRLGCRLCYDLYWADLI